MGRSDDYVRVKAILIGPTRDAVMIARVSDVNRSPDFKPLIIPKSLIHSADLSKLTWESATEIVEFRLREWKAEDLDL